MFDIKEHVKDRKVVFLGAAAGNLWYVTEPGFEFPVPFDDMGEATFEAEDRAMLFMRYIRKHAGAEAPARYPGDRGVEGCEFTRARAGNLWYRDADGFEFPVPFAAMGDEAFPARIDPARVAAHKEYHAGLTAQAA